MNQQEKDYKKLLRLYEAYAEEFADYFSKYPAIETQDGDGGPGSNPPPPPPPPPTLP